MVLHPLTRAVLVAGILLTAGTGVGLWLAADRTADFWAWTIGNPLTAATMGAGYCGAALGLGLALRANEWTRARPVALAALTLTSLSLLATLRHLDDFAFDDPDRLPQVVAWIWLAVYVALPPLLLVVVAVEERAARRGAGGPVLSPAVLAALVAVALALAAYGVLLIAGVEAVADAWPWPLPPLPAEVIGAWLVTVGVLCAGAAIPGRRRVARDPLIAAALALALVAVALVRFSGSLDA